ncbi:hypothetical protein KFL_008560010, partial [Klebsormidium nitens]
MPADHATMWKNVRAHLQRLVFLVGAGQKAEGPLEDGKVGKENTTMGKVGSSWDWEMLSMEEGEGMPAAYEHLSQRDPYELYDRKGRLVRLKSRAVQEAVARLEQEEARLTNENLPVDYDNGPPSLQRAYEEVEVAITHLDKATMEAEECRKSLEVWRTILLDVQEILGMR